MNPNPPKTKSFVSKPQDRRKETSQITHDVEKWK